jgi:immune inhibitor A
LKIRMSILPTTVAISALLFSSLSLATSPQRENFKPINGKSVGGGDNFSHPLGEKQSALKKKAIEAKLMGKASGKVHEVAKGQYVELTREGEDLIWTVMAEFGTEEYYLGGDPGPLHNTIPEPDRDFDNTTIWTADFNRDYYMDILFADGEDDISMRNFYIENSSNRYSVDGDVTDWGKVPFNTKAYAGGPEGTDSDVWFFVWDSLEDWYNAKVAEGWTQQDFDDHLSKYDVWDRYDYDGDSVFDEPDGYIDHFQSVHAGMGEEAGGGTYGTDAIWSHRWYAFYNLEGSWGPAYNLAGGVPIGDTGYWVGDYTIEPENGGVGVFAHEFAHDLDLPDLYNTGSGGSNSVAFWSLMASGSWTSQDPENIGSAPVHMGAWEKFQLGWLNYEVAFAGSKSEHKLGPAETNTKQAQALFVVLPDKVVSQYIGDPYSGEYFYYSGAGNNLFHSMARSVTLPAGAVTLTAMVNYEIETDWDYAYLTVDGYTVATDHSTNTNPNENNFGEGITGVNGGWTALTADLSAYAEQTVEIGFYYITDGAVAELGFMVDDIQITSLPIDDAESDFGWVYDGFMHTSGTESASYFNAYVAEFRQYRGYDMGLKTGPYNYYSADTAERFPYQDGLLISYWDTSEANNNTATHPGSGLILPIDAHPEAMEYPINGDIGWVWSASRQSFDSTFGKDATDEITLHSHGFYGEPTPMTYPSLPGVPVFDDNNQYWNPVTPLSGVMNPHTGTQIRVKSVSAKGGYMQVEVRPKK